MAEENKEAAAPAPPAAAAGGGTKAWLPLILVVVLMPGLAYLTTSFVLVPKLKRSLGLPAVNAREAEDGGESAGKESKEEFKHEGKTPQYEIAKGKGPKTKIALSKIVVNVSGSLGSRLLLASFTMASNAPTFRERVDENTDQLRDIASSILASKTIADLEKPEARNLVRAEILSQFNAVLGGVVQEVYITELAIQ
jgi:flagellar basal body-associated protein FliL